MGDQSASPPVQALPVVTPRTSLNATSPAASRSSPPQSSSCLTIRSPYSSIAGSPESMARSSPSVRAHTRASPYPLRVRTPTQSPSPAPSQLPQPAGEERRLQLLIRPIIKTTIGQRDTSGQALDDIVFTGSTFNDIKHKIWEAFSSHVKCRATKADGAWAVEVPVEADWTKVMHFKSKGHIVDNAKSEIQWNQWVTKARGQTVTLLIYEYGVSITKAQDLDAFKAACIQPEHTDRAGAASEEVIRDLLAQLQEQWQSTFRAHSVVWRMWANAICRNLDRSTWQAAIAQPPPAHIANLLRPADTDVEQHIEGVVHSANVALESVRASIEDNKQLREYLEAFGRRLDISDQRLQTRLNVIEAFIRDIAPPARNAVMDPFLQLQNADDTDHAE